MPKLSKLTAPSVEDFGATVDRSGDVDGYTIEFVSLGEDQDLAPFLKGLPGDACQCPHWGYLFSGRITVGYDGREEVVEPGDAFYFPAGHVLAATAGSEILQFSNAAELATTKAAIMRNAQARQAAQHS
jgi:Cupin domain